MAVLLAFDPGKTTGFVYGRYEDDQPFEIDQVGHATTEEYFSMLGVLEEGGREVTVVCEDFVLRRGKAMTSDQTSPLILIGALQYVAFQDQKTITVVMQSPSAAKQVTDEHLDKLGFLRTPKTKWDHANDAMRHAVLYLKNNKHMPTLEGGFK